MHHTYVSEKKAKRRMREYFLRVYTKEEHGHLYQCVCVCVCGLTLGLRLLYFGGAGHAPSTPHY